MKDHDARPAGSRADYATAHRRQPPLPASAVTATVFTLVVLLASLVGGSIARAASSTPVSLGTAGSFAILAGAGITNTGVTTISGDVGTFPTTSETGFTPCGPPPADCVALTGTDHAGDSVTQGAKTDLITAYNQAASYPRTTIPTELGPSNPDPLLPGVYTSESTTFGITGTLTLDAQNVSDAVFIFYMGSVGTSLTTAVGSNVVLQNGAQACNVWWVVAGTATLFANSNFKGNILAYASITLENNVTVDGRLLAQTGSVTLIHDTITRATCAQAPAETATPTAAPTAAPATPTAAPTATGAVPTAAPSPTNARPTNARPTKAPPTTSTLPDSGGLGGGLLGVLLTLLALTSGLFATVWVFARRRIEPRDMG